MKISEVPMLTADEHEIKLNGVIYDYSWKNGYGFKAIAESKITAYRVISINESARHFRARCAKGCEIEVSYKNGCDRHKYYGSLASIRELIEKEAQEDLDRCHKKKVDIDKTEKAIIQAMKSVKATKVGDVKLPKLVNIVK